MAYGDIIYIIIIKYVFMLCRISFSSAIMISAASLVLERAEGMLDRTYVAG